MDGTICSCEAALLIEIIRGILRFFSLVKNFVYIYIRPCVFHDAHVGGNFKKSVYFFLLLGS